MTVEGSKSATRWRFWVRSMAELDRTAILSAIRTQAAANGGVPIGVMRFEALTGIKQTAWRGKYWARWGDAVREAGYEPNTLQKPYSDDDLFDALTALAREVGHFPTKPEIDLRRRADSTFPSPNVFARLGRKAEVASKMLERCANDPRLEDVAAMCRPAAVERRRGPEAVASGDGPVAGDVYLMKSGQHYKIGRSNSSGRRSYELAIQLPERLEMVHVIRTDDAVGIERYWHQRYASRRLNGEWFALSKADVAAFKRRKFM